ncbi:MAG: nucleotidyl transferase AbiEii/AbiGii toxin family protein [Deltaproteobacteria bacterium]|nr:nucleotidyl transferase AbiEii/AbiGii toxin family protein [Deltaproteobacteria bacterium]
MSSSPPGSRELPKPVDVRAALTEVSERLSLIPGDRALIGGVALAFHGVERFTKDADFAVTLAQTDGAAVVFADSDPRPLRVGGISVLTKSGVRVDLVDRRHELQPLFEEAIAAANRKGSPRARIGELEIPVVPVSYLVAMKLAAGRARDEWDVDQLLRLPTVDYGATRELVKRFLGAFAARYLDRLARAAGRKDAPRDYEAEEPNGG